MAQLSVPQNNVVQTQRRGRMYREMNNEELARLASLYYVDGLTQEELSRMYSTSRVRIGRLIQKAQQDGIVEIRVRPSDALVADLERALIARFGIRKAILSLDHKDPDKQLSLLAGQVAGYLDQTLIDGSIVAVGSGRNINAVSEHVMSARPRACVFVSAIGGSHHGGQSYNADHIARRLALRFGGECESIYAPALVNNAALRNQLLENDAVRHTLNKARRAEIALIGVGTMSEGSNIVRMGWFSRDEVEHARQSGTVGEVMGYEFIDSTGSLSAPELQDRMIGLTLPDLKAIADVVAVASETTKIDGLYGLLNAGVVDTLAITTGCARGLLER